ncbi:iron transporter [Bacillus subtilis subsp. subtilis]|uniref:Iron permease EfeU n=5 Tax=Bacilli TaxID=91061 RepID=EFEU_BACSU|nr:MULTISPECIES: ferrous ion permease EfeU [Bacillales]NP_391707.2 ferrous ion permease [Bacillus subtilis subsp. subtilis str. 168]P39595.2 RecName: Full=Iron permease EfeU; AltName: Full=Fe(3+) ion permease EfeU; AltName: Full=Ferric iron permease EfeU; AltName: Full=Ferric iron uptake protein; Flags: Precursor [Bacillus subtilis subsp. subtilis str. 168]BAM55911.1 ferrous ion permease [Bacillus subtilis BEST7613]AFQ59680.1 Ferrous ion permease [Bacillus subtilis QB928]AGG63242.1 ferrous ion
MARGLALILFSLLMVFGSAAHAEDDPIAALIQLNKQMIKSVKDGDMDSAQQTFDTFKAKWKKEEPSIKKENLSSHSEMDANIAMISLSFINQDARKLKTQLEELASHLETYQQAVVLKKTSSGQSRASLTAYIQSLKDTKQFIEKKQLDEASSAIDNLVTSWLAVEGDVVSQSKEAYTTSEENLALMKAEIGSHPEKVSKQIDEMIQLLEPIASSSYSWWDAALIPVREGMEALLVIGALLTMTKKARVTRSSTWIWGGASAGMAVSLAAGIGVTVLFSSSVFGENNFLLGGVTGVLSAVMLLYVGVWLHRNASMDKWREKINIQKSQALKKRSLLSFALIAFLAVVREGLETVIFFIGLVGKLPLTELIGGTAAGLIVLVIVGVLMIKLGMRIPLKPFFLLSMAVVLYMCVKFLGTGVHSLQLAGILPSDAESWLPSVSVLGIYPSVYSTIPQMLILLFLLIALVSEAAKHFTNGKELTK